MAALDHLRSSETPQGVTLAPTDGLQLRQNPTVSPPALRTKPHANSVSQHLIRKKKMTGQRKPHAEKKKRPNRVCRSMDWGQVPPRRQKNKGVRHCHLCPSRRAQGRAAEGEWSGGVQTPQMEFGSRAWRRRVRCPQAQVWPWQEPDSSPPGLREHGLGGGPGPAREVWTGFCVSCWGTPSAEP